MDILDNLDIPRSPEAEKRYKWHRHVSLQLTSYKNIGGHAHCGAMSKYYGGSEDFETWLRSWPGNLYFYSYVHRTPKPPKKFFFRIKGAGGVKIEYTFY